MSSDKALSTEAKVGHYSGVLDRLVGLYNSLRVERSECTEHGGKQVLQPANPEVIKHIETAIIETTELITQLVRGEQSPPPRAN